MFSELPTMLSSFLVLSISMNLPKSRKRSVSVGIAGDSRLYKQSSQEIPLPSPIPYVKILTNSISDENGIILIMHPFHFVQHAADRNGGA